MPHKRAMEWQSVSDPVSGVRICRLTGTLTDSREAYDLVGELRAGLRTDPRPLLLNLRGVEHLASPGVGMIATLFTSARNANVPLAFCGLSPRARHLLEIVHLLHFIKAYADEADALAGLASGGWEVVS